MNDTRIRPLLTHNLLRAYSPTQKPQQAGGGFGDMLKQAVGKVNEAQNQADFSVQRAISGQETDVHRVMIAQEEAAMTFELLMEVRNKLMDAYQQIMQMQI